MGPSRRVAMVLTAIALACGPSVSGGGATEGLEGTDASTTPSTSSNPTAASTTTGDSAATAGADTTSAAESTSEHGSSTGVVEVVCEDGLFEGMYFSGFESSAIELCDGPPGGVWVRSGGPFGCSDVWVAIEGTLCGPGQYGHLGGSAYELTGTLVEGPCISGSCGSRPSGCGPSDQICGGIQECDLVAQDCPAGEKCVPTSSSDGPPWTGTSCFPHPPATGSMGDPCFTENDDCGPGLFCWDDDPTAREGYCVHLCAPGMVPCKTGGCTPCEGDVDFGMCLPGECDGGRCTC